MGSPDADNLGRDWGPLAPDVGAVISSGYSETGNPLSGLDAEFLPKPYEPDALLRAVRRALDQRRRRAAAGK